jgi:hypothetical protein
MLDPPHLRHPDPLEQAVGRAPRVEQRQQFVALRLDIQVERVEPGRNQVQVVDVMKIDHSMLGIARL